MTLQQLISTLITNGSKQRNEAVSAVILDAMASSVISWLLMLSGISEAIWLLHIIPKVLKPA